VKTLKLILGDQLNLDHSWFKTADTNTIFCLFEMRQETDYVTHHIQKIVGFFAAMRNFAQNLEEAGHTVIYYKINDSQNTQSLTQNILQIIEKHNIENFEYQLPDEYRLDEQLKTFCNQLHIPFSVANTEHFLSERHTVAQLFEGKKQILMETFYRQMRKQYSILLEPDGKPIGGKWNYDAENRNKWKGTPIEPKHNAISNNLEGIFEEIKQSGANYFGNINAKEFNWPISQEQANIILDYFIKHSLPYFGQFQDAMSQKAQLLFHSRLSFALNIKLISPLYVVQKCIEAWLAKPALISLPQIEGFVRQIIGWREYMRGIYWWKMPEYETLNYFNHQTKLPEYFWTGKTNMNCVKNAVQNSLDNAYAHHIQRLMVTGNFTLLAGIDPSEVDNWYLGIYIDAIQWVEITNTRGMSQFADGGIVGSKPYVSSANYIDKMSDYCGNCHYDKKLKYGKNACPFNSLYWHFYERNRPLLEKNNRIGMMYNVLNRMAADEKQKTLAQADYYLNHLEEL
jgi:deoxyribodipyrimidine photolyase-related protein